MQYRDANGRVYFLHRAIPVYVGRAILHAVVEQWRSENT